jgi:23S rRNA (uracil1939-C5)-methyltransferase
MPFVSCLFAVNLPGDVARAPRKGAAALRRECRTGSAGLFHATVEVSLTLPTELTDQAQLQPVQLQIEKLVYGGEGLARSDGRVVLLPFVLPGERVQASVHRAKNDLLRGTATQILEPASTRIDPACPYFARCGGCHYQHAPAAYQTEQKVAILREALKRVGRIEYAGEIGIVADDPWHYRNRAQLHVSGGKVGYFAAGSHELIPLDHCPIGSPRLNDAIASLARDLPHYRFFDGTLELFTNETDVQVNILDRVPTSVRGVLDALGTSDPIEYGAFRVSRNSFFQVNRFLTDRLVEAAIGDAAGDTALDLYAGVGLFAHRMAARFSKVTAVESGHSAFRDLEFNGQRSGLAVHPVRKTAEEHLATLDKGPDLVVADPPRTGIGKVATRELLRLRPARITIVSCDPATLARDLAVLIPGGYKMERLTLVDLFPQTYHLETVVHLGL